MPTTSWTKKDERQYEAIKESAEERGDGDRAAEIAARTVNKRRRLEGRTANRKTQGTGNPNKPLSQRTVAELRNLAAKHHIRGRSRMTKSALVQALGDLKE